MMNSQKQWILNNCYLEQCSSPFWTFTGALLVMGSLHLGAFEHVAIPGPDHLLVLPEFQVLALPEAFSCSTGFPILNCDVFIRICVISFAVPSYCIFSVWIQFYLTAIIWKNLKKKNCAFRNIAYFLHSEIEHALFYHILSRVLCDF